MMQYAKKHVEDYKMRYTASAVTYIQKKNVGGKMRKTPHVPIQTNDDTLEVMTNK